MNAEKDMPLLSLSQMHCQRNQRYRRMRQGGASRYAAEQWALRIKDHCQKCCNDKQQCCGVAVKRPYKRWHWMRML